MTSELGLYFVEGPDGVHIESAEQGFYTTTGPIDWFSIGFDVGRPRPDGQTVSGPYTIAELHEAMKIATELPKTADGVIVAPGRTVYHPRGTEESARMVEYCDFNTCCVSWEEHYSTPEAAAAAREEEQHRA